MFPSIQTDKAELEVEELLERNKSGKQDGEKWKMKLLIALRLCLAENWFTWDGKVYIQKTGLFMGSNLSPVLAEMVVRKKMSETVTNIGRDCKLLSRFVDDILGCSSGEWAKCFEKEWNGMQDKLKIEVEFENGVDEHGKVEFLDMCVFRNGDKLQSKWECKEYATNRVVARESGHEWKVKKGVVKGLFKRAERACTDVEMFKVCSKKVCKIVEESGYKKEQVEKWLAEEKQVKEKEERLPNVVLPFFGNLSHKLKDVFNGKASVSFRYCNKLGNGLALRKEGVEGWERGLVYLIECRDCDKGYVGETGRCLSSRLVEHKADVRMGRDKNAIAKHVLEFDHCIDWGNGKVIGNSIENWYKRRVVEGLWINRLEDSIMNGNVGIQGLEGWNKFW
jgi:hypothetical protein